MSVKGSYSRRNLVSRRGQQRGCQHHERSRVEQARGTRMRRWAGLRDGSFRAAVQEHRQNVFEVVAGGKDDVESAIVVEVSDTFGIVAVDHGGLAWDEGAVALSDQEFRLGVTVGVRTALLHV